MTPEQQKALAAGREKAAKTRRKAAVRRVKDYRTWLKDDVAHSMDVIAHEAGIGPHPGKRPVMPEVPSDHDFLVADGRA